MRTLKKIIILSAIALLVSILQGCPNVCMHKFFINKTEIQLIDNSGKYPTINPSPFQHRDAISFALLLIDTTSFYHYSYYAERRNLNLIKTAQAIRCEELFTLGNSLRDIKVTTLYSISSSIMEDEDVTDYFGYDLKKSNYANLYSSVSQIINAINGTESFTNYPVTVLFFLNQPLEVDSARFRVDVLLDNGIVLSAESPTIYTKENL